MKKITVLLASTFAMMACSTTNTSSQAKSSSPLVSSTQQVTSEPQTTSEPQVTSSKQDQQSSRQGQSSSNGQKSSEQGQSSEQQVTSSEQQQSSEQGQSSEQQQSSEQGQSSEQQQSSEQGQSSEQQQSTPSGGGINVNDYLLKHTEGASANYIFEAECTDLRGKAGSGYSGGATGSGLATHNAENISYVTFLYTKGISVNFFVACDRNVTNAKLRARFGAEFIYVLLNPENYSFRVDQAIDPAYLTDFDPDDLDSDGSLGNWDAFFLDYYDVDETDGYFIEDWECEEIEIDASNQSDVVGWGTFDITFSLSLKEGINCISLITINDDIIGDAPHGTMTATAPVIDYISIETTAQLGAFNVQDNGEGENAVHFAA